MTNFDSTKASLTDLLREIAQGKIQLPDFQRGWVWDDAEEVVHAQDSGAPAPEARARARRAAAVGFIWPLPEGWTTGRWRRRCSGRCRRRGSPDRSRTGRMSTGSFSATRA